jgi:hypothetical protein
LTQNGQIAVDVAERVVILGHHGAIADFCPSNSKFSCFATKEIAFSIPRDRALLGKGSEWIEGGHRFIVQAVDEEIVLIGQRLNVLRIESPTQQPALQFWFEINRGLVGIQGLDGPTRRLFLLRERCGFASDPKCW